MRTLLAGLLAVGALVAASAQTPAAADLVRQLQARYDTVRSFTADTVNTSKSGIVPQSTTDRGTVKVRKPGHINFVTTSPTAKQLVSDGIHVTDWRGGSQADRYLMPKGETSTALMFLAGRGNLTRDFTASLPDQPNDAEWQIRLLPKTPQSDYTTLTLFVQRTTLRLNGYDTVDHNGGHSTMRFSNIKENVELSDNDFVFSPTRKVLVVDR